MYTERAILSDMRKCIFIDVMNLCDACDQINKTSVKLPNMYPVTNIVCFIYTSSGMALIGI